MNNIKYTFHIWYLTRNIEFYFPKINKMNKTETLLLVERVFDVITTANTLTQIQNLLISEPELKANKINTLKYPRIEFNFSSNDINNLLSKNYISDDYKLKISSIELEKESVLTKLLYSIIWKNGDLGKEKHILEGISNRDKNDDKALVFYQFGKYLGDPSRKEPIVDQHTLRAYGVFLCIKNEIGRIIEKIPNRKKNTAPLNDDYYRKLSSTTKKEIPLIQDYKNWIMSHKLYSDIDFVYTLDLVLFSLGKSIKSNSHKSAIL